MSVDRRIRLADGWETACDWLFCAKGQALTMNLPEERDMRALAEKLTDKEAVKTIAFIYGVSADTHEGPWKLMGMRLEEWPTGGILVTMRHE